MKAIQKIKDKVIHILGGITEEELVKYQVHQFFQGKKEAYLEMHNEAILQYGKPADEWCKVMYNHIAQNYDRNYKEYIQASKELDKDGDDRIYRKL